ncbi:MAG: hypothetical protein RDV48_22745 [Candidatus Eremiobacteraeota bacterium]|nr:hypothetical protein [Candidatus Eremiobacteraeota bacterium]
MARENLTWSDYVKEAFNLRVKVPAMGKVPVNWVALGGLAAAGVFVGWPMLLIGAGAELGYLYMLSTNPRFQKVIQGKELLKKREQWEQKKTRIFNRLSQGARARYQDLERKCQNVVSIYETASIETGHLDTSRLAILNQLLWLALRLLLSREVIIKNIKNESRDNLQKKIDNMEKNMQNESNERIKKTLESTIETMKKRLGNITSADEKIKTIDLELLRIEEQLELLQNVAAIDGQSGTLSDKIDSTVTSINETDEWMKTNAELFGPIEEELAGPPDGIIESLKSTDTTTT